MNAKLSRLVDLAGVANHAAQARYNSLRNEEAALRQQISTLLSDRHDATSDQRSAQDTAFAAGADLRWHRWIESRIAQINTALASNRAAQLRARADLKTAFGREMALKALLKQDIAAERQALVRRARNAPF